MIEAFTPRGLVARVPATQEADPSRYFDAQQSQEIREYYDREGYVIVRNLLEESTCDHMRGLWEREVKPSTAFVYRQATAKSEQHVFNAAGWVMNPILNIQSVDPRRFPEFREFGCNRILTAESLRDVLETLLGDRPKIVQSMYFEGNSATWEHQDTYYLDSEPLGRMVGSWIALEDIGEYAGRFFVVPRSHLVQLPLQSIDTNVATNHERYIASVVAEVRRLNLEVRAPALKKGDVLFWNSYTVHGSLATQDEKRSRSSITCHAIPESSRFTQLQSRIVQIDDHRINGVIVHAPKDLTRASARAIHLIESHFPKAFYSFKGLAVRLMIARSAAKRREAASTN